MRTRLLPFVCVLLLVQAIVTTASGSDPVSVNADLRYRHELTDVEDQDARNRHRIRGRLALQGNPNDWLELELRIVTGSSNPTTLMQTLDGGFSDKP